MLADPEGNEFCLLRYDRDKLVGRRRFQDLLATGDRVFYDTHAAPMLFMRGMLGEIAVKVISASGRGCPCS